MLNAYGNNKHLAAALRQAKQAGDTAFIEQHRLASIKVPEQWKLYFQAYLRLEGDRPSDLAPIPWSAMAHYCRFYRLTTDQSDWLIEIIEQVDNAVLEKRKKDADKGGKNPKQSGGKTKQAGRSNRR